jgi:hypothetical protein
MAVDPETTWDWSEISRSDLGDWDRRLLGETDARVEQYPFWNERSRAPMVTLRYLQYGPANAPSAYVCVFTIGIRGLRVGLVANGPTSLEEGRDISPEMARAFASWARRNHYAFVRFTHRDVRILDSMSSYGRVEEGDPFRTYFAPDSELVVNLTGDDAQLLGGFQDVARRLVRQASRADYTFQSTDSPEELAALWPFFLEHARLKGLVYRPLAGYMKLMTLARPIQTARLHIASLGETPVNAILILRDRRMAHYLLGASDVGAFEGRPSPSCLLHYKAMQDAYQAGARAYNFGIRGGPVYTFKKKFRPTEIFYPKPRVMILNRPLYRLWDLLVCRYSSTFITMLNGLQRQKRLPASGAGEP